MVGWLASAEPSIPQSQPQDSVVNPTPIVERKWQGISITRSASGIERGDLFVACPARRLSKLLRGKGRNAGRASQRP